MNQRKEKVMRRVKQAVGEYRGIKLLLLTSTVKKKYTYVCMFDTYVDVI